MIRGFVQHNELNLSYIDFGGEGQSVLLLHGLMGRATTWQHTAELLKPRYHVIGLDQRGHGLSSKPDNAYSRDDYVNDTIAVIEALKLAPTIIIGHSMGALNAWVLAARRPELVKALILEDMGAKTTSRKENEEWKQWLSTWPVPFPSMLHVRQFFANQRPAWADFFMEVMSEGEDGYRPMFSFEHILQSQLDWDNHDYWPELQKVKCPTLLVKGADSQLAQKEVLEMLEALPNGRYTEIVNAAHVVHYDQPEAWNSVIWSFLRELE